MRRGGHQGGRVRRGRVRRIGRLLADVDAVVVCSETCVTGRLWKRAARAGKHVLCEKPLATTPDDARAMVAACDKAGVQLMTAFPCRFSPAFEQLAEAVRRGDIGNVLAVRGTNRGRCPGGWFTDPALSGGGAVMDHTVHVTDLLRALLRSEPAEVFCEAGNGILHGDFDDTGFLAITSRTACSPRSTLPGRGPKRSRPGVT
jgi:predicted dehydrogenase